MNLRCDTSKYKLCSWCGRLKHLSSFMVQGGRDGGHMKICRLCWKQRHLGMYKRYYRRRMVTKVCADCGWPLPVIRFYRDKKQPDGRSPICKSCQDGRELRALETMKPCREMRNLRRCRVCDEIKPLDSFYKCRTMPFGHGYRCSDCARKRREELRRERREPPPMGPGVKSRNA